MNLENSTWTEETHDTILTISKEKSQYIHVYFVDDMDDGSRWFIKRARVKKSTGKIVDGYTFTVKNIPIWITYANNMLGFKDYKWTKKYNTPKKRLKLLGYEFNQ